MCFVKFSYCIMHLLGKYWLTAMLIDLITDWIYRDISGQRQSDSKTLPLGRLPGRRVGGTQHLPT